MLAALLCGVSAWHATTFHGTARTLVSRTRHVQPCLCAQEPISQPGKASKRTVVLPKSELLSAAGTSAVKKKKGIRSVTVGGTRIDFAHDMTNTFIWGGIILTMAVYKVAKAGKSAFIDEPNYKHIARNQAEETELHEFCCEKCGFTMFPARGREGKFFPDDYKCLQCGAPKESFFDMTDLSDERTVNAIANDEDFDYVIEEIVVPTTGDLLEDITMQPSSRATAPLPSASPSITAPPPPPPSARPPASDESDYDPLNDPLL